jgi:peptidyl-prolyl cis-trans isomerase B (cyclophilin B)
MLYRLMSVALAFSLAASTAIADTPQRVRMTTNQGDIVIEMNAEAAPKSVENFLRYVIDGFYDGIVFHRSIAKFMVQGGGFTSDLQRKETGAAIENEADNRVTNARGTIAMARTSDPHSATAQFFFNLADNKFLDHKAKSPKGWGYAVFGKVVEGMEVVDQIASMPTVRKGRFANLPADTIIIERAVVDGAQ